MSILVQLETESKVLEVYRKVSPSFTPIDSNAERLTYESKRHAYLQSMGLSPSFFQGKRLVDIGGGTGEASLYYALWGADVTLVEPNEISIAQKKKIFQREGKSLTVVQDSLFNLNQTFLENFDVIISDGVIHHTYDPVKALRSVLEGARPGTVIMIGMCETHGFFKRTLQRKLIQSLAGADETKIIEFSKKFFAEHLERAHQFGLRSIETIIFDTYVNPQVQPTPLRDICDTFQSCGVQYLRAFPTLDYFGQAWPWQNEFSNRFDYTLWADYYQFLEKIWMTSSDTQTEKREAAQFTPLKLIQRVESEAQTLMELEGKINKGTFTEKDLAPIQKGSLGVGQNNFLGIKV